MCFDGCFGASKYCAYKRSCMNVRRCMDLIQKNGTRVNTHSGLTLENQMDQKRWRFLVVFDVLCSKPLISVCLVWQTQQHRICARLKWSCRILFVRQCQVFAWDSIVQTRLWTCGFHIFAYLHVCASSWASQNQTWNWNFDRNHSYSNSLGNSCSSICWTNRAQVNQRNLGQFPSLIWMIWGKPHFRNLTLNDLTLDKIWTWFHRIHSKELIKVD